MSLFEDIHNPTLSTVASVKPHLLMATVFLNAVTDEDGPPATCDEDTVVDGDGETVVIPEHAFC